MVRCLGYWWNDHEIEIYEVEGRLIALWGWNGEIYLDCWEVEEMVDEYGYGIKTDGLQVRPIYEKHSEDDYDIVGYEFV